MKTLLFFTCILAANAAWVKEMENVHMFEGDIDLDPDEFEQGWNKSRSEPTTYASIKGGRWPGGVIPYRIESSLGRSVYGVINKAITNYHKNTCIRFKKRTNERTYVSFYSGKGCSSPIGYRSGRVNRISLAPGCRIPGIVMHEIGHTLGFYHEQSRPDRDRFVDIIWANIKEEAKFNFNKQPSNNINSLGTAYDFGSMMHYGARSFSKNNKDTIRTKNRKYQSLIGQRKGFSKTDIRQLNLMYKSQCGGNDAGAGAGGKECKDSSKNCARWAKRGFCAKSKKYMKKFCKKSCKMC